MEKYPTLESRRYHTKKGDLKIHKFAPDVHKAMSFMTSAGQTVTPSTIANCFRKSGIRHEDSGLLAFADPLTEVMEMLDVIKVDMARIRPSRTATLTTDNCEEVTLDRLLDPYRATIPTADDEDDSEPPRLITASDLRESLPTVKLYIQQQWDPGKLSLAFEVVDETAIAVQEDLHNLERRLATLQLRKPQRQTPITYFFGGSGGGRSSGGSGGSGGR
ncbi:hypothetical protein EV426DRAFT_606293 [Tirmania nivea]|nr:hypothetical protein EV426DRAFT_606293 [Tirmania nivea]